MSDAVERALSDVTLFPLWLDNPAAPAVEGRLIGRTEADLVIVGGGFTGLWGALQAKEANPEREVVLIEAHTIPTGASARPCAIFSTSVMHGLSNALRLYPNDMETLEALGRDNFEGFNDALARHEINAEVEWGGEMTVAVGEANIPAVKEEFELHKKYGHDIVYLDKDQVQEQLRSPLFAAGMYTRSHSGTLHPAKLCWGLKASALKLGVKIYELTPLTRLEPRGAEILVKTHDGEIRARKVLLATNAFGAGHKHIKRRVAAIRDRIIATEPLSEEQLARLGWANRQGVYDTRTQLNYMRLTKDNRMLFGGRLGYYFNNETDPQADRDIEVYRRLTGTFLQTFPQLDDVKVSHAWGGPIALTTRMSVHFQPYHDGRVLYAGGYSGFGVSGSRFGSRLALAILDDEKIPERELALAKTMPNMILPEPFRWIGAKMTMYALDGVDEKGGWRRPWLRLVRALGFPIY
ncbi:MAG: FAD-binding oxidoreductase [Pseudomonadota bacterium]